MIFDLKTKGYVMCVGARVGAGRESGGYSKHENIVERNYTAGNILCHRINSPVSGILISPCSLPEGWLSDLLYLIVHFIYSHNCSL